MDCLDNRNPPFSPFSVNSVTEIRRPPYKRGVSSVIPVGGVAMIETKDGRLFSFTGAEPYTRKDGTETTLHCWRGACLVCGAGFTVKTPVLLDGSKALGRKHCDAHKLTPEQVNALWDAATGGRHA
jgi:hypothetical protein